MSKVQYLQTTLDKFPPLGWSFRHFIRHLKPFVHMHFTKRALEDGYNCSEVVSYREYGASLMAKETPSSALHIFPDRRLSNPFQSVLYSQSPSSGLKTVYYSELRKIMSSDLQPNEIVHLCWISSIVKDKSFCFEVFRDWVLDQNARGVRILCTLLGDDLDGDLRTSELLNCLVPAAEKIHVMSLTDLERARKNCSIPEDKLILITCPGFHTVVGVNSVRKYRRRKKIAVLGSVGENYFNNRISFETIKNDFRVSEKAALIMNSDFVWVGDKSVDITSIQFAASFGKIVICEKYGPMGDLLEDGADAILYGNNDDLNTVFERVISLEPKDFYRMSKNALKKSYALAPCAVSGEFTDFLKRGESLEKSSFQIDNPIYGPMVVETRLQKCKSQLGVVIVNYNSSADLLVCIASIKSSMFSDLTIYVVDSGSSQEERIKLSSMLNVSTILLNRNVGYAAANNIGVEQALKDGCDHIMICNPDIHFSPNAIGDLLGASGSIGDAIISPRINFYGETRVWGGIHRVRPNKNYSVEVESIPFDAEPTQKTDYAGGACLLFSKETWAKAGKMPEQYFLYFEETAWCIMAKQKGIDSIIAKEMTVEHKKRSSSYSPRAYYLYYMIRNKLNFSRDVFDLKINEYDRAHDTFVTGWEGRIPDDKRPVFDEIINLAISDGKKGVYGKIDEDQMRDFEKRIFF